MRHKGLVHQEVAHIWANPRCEDDHASGFNMFFKGDTIYSYGRHFPIARHVENEQGESAVLFTTESYGISTGKHKTYTSRACRHLTLFHVPIIETSFSKFGVKDNTFNMRHYQASYDGIIDRAHRINSQSYGGISFYIQAAKNVLQEGNAYAVFFDLNDCVIPAFKAKLNWLVARYERLTSPEAEARREVARDKRLAAERKRYAVTLDQWASGKLNRLPLDISHLVTPNQQKRRDNFDREKYAEQIETWASGKDPDENRRSPWGRGRDWQRLATPAQTEQHRLFEEKRNAEIIAQWLAGDSVHLPHMPTVYLRVNGNAAGNTGYHGNREIETSQHARFPIEDGIRLFRFIQIIRKRGKCYKPSVEQAPMLGYYRVDRIATDGAVRAGCHTVPWSSIERLARELDLL